MFSVAFFTKQILICICCKQWLKPCFNKVINTLFHLHHVCHTPLFNTFKSHLHYFHFVFSQIMSHFFQLILWMKHPRSPGLFVVSMGKRPCHDLEPLYMWPQWLCTYLNQNNLISHCVFMDKSVALFSIFIISQLLTLLDTKNSKSMDCFHNTGMLFCVVCSSTVCFCQKSFSQLLQKHS